MSRDTTEKVSTATGAPSTGSTMPPVPRPGGAGSSQGASTPANGTPAVRPAERTGTPPTIAPASSGGAPGTSSGAPKGAGGTKPTGKAPATKAPASQTGAGKAPTTAPAQSSGPASATTAGAATTAAAPRSPRTSVLGTGNGASTGSSSSAAAESAPVKKVAGAPRKVRLSVSRVDPWSVMKLSFLLSIAMGIMLVVAAVVFWLVLDSLHVFTEVNEMVVSILEGGTTEVDILQFVELSRFVSVATIIAIVDVVIFTALGTIGAFLYNIVAALVGGIHLTMTDD